MSVEAIVLAGGFGTRLREVVPDWPKPMAPVAGRPFLEILLRSLAGKGVARAVLSVGYMADKIIGHLGAQFAGIELVYEVETQPMGTGGAVAASMRRCTGDRALVVNGDTFLDLELDALERAYQGHPIIVAREVDDTARYGRLDTAAGQVTRFSEKGVSGPGLINAGAYLLPVGLLDSAGLSAPFSLEADFLAPAVLNRRFDVFITRGQFIDIGVPADYRRAQTMNLGGTP